MHTGGTTHSSGTLGLKLIRGTKKRNAPWTYHLRNFPNIWRGLWRKKVADALGIPTFFGELHLVVVKADGTRINYGRVSTRVVTTAGMNALVDAMQNLIEPEIFKYHAFGTGTTAEAVGDTALVTELTTEYNPNSTRPTGTQIEGASANIYRTVATLTPDSGGTLAITEHGLMSQAATGGGTLWDRSKFAAVNLDTTAGDSVQATYDWTASTGG